MHTHIPQKNYNKTSYRSKRSTDVADQDVSEVRIFEKIRRSEVDDLNNDEYFFKQFNPHPQQGDTTLNGDVEVFDISEGIKPPQNQHPSGTTNGSTLLPSVPDDVEELPETTTQINRKVEFVHEIITNFNKEFNRNNKFVKDGSKKKEYKITSLNKDHGAELIRELKDRISRRDKENSKKDDDYEESSRKIKIRFN